MVTTLRRKMTISTVTLIASLFLLVGGVLYVMLGVINSLEGISDEFEEFQIMARLDIHIASVRGNLLSNEPSLPVIITELRKSINLLNTFVAFQESEGYTDIEHQLEEEASSKSLIHSLNQTITELEHTDPASLAMPDRIYLATSVKRVLNRANEMVELFGRRIKTEQKNTQKTLRTTALAIGAASILIGLLGSIISIIQYRRVIRPLSNLRTGTRLAASGKLNHKVKVEGDQEFVELANDFNHMTNELKCIYEELEERVAAKSKQLVRSERLASVGYLAAGVAHEINNPLNIISGYAEILLKQLNRADSKLSSTDSTNELRIIHEESFRCKQIIQKLLSLTRGAENTRIPVDLAHLASEIISMINGLKKYNGKCVRLDFESGLMLTTLASEPEMKQVLLNLTINALEAIDYAKGEVIIGGCYEDGWVRLTIQDNGCGMTPKTRDKIFEPFFTLRHGKDNQGTGLGLSIVHAIIADYGGQITAHSDGPGLGSRFVIRLPRVPQEEIYDQASYI